MTDQWRRPHMVERDSVLWKTWRKGHGRCATCNRDWVPKKGWLADLIEHLDPKTDRPCAGRKWRGQP